ncbi:signal transduction histidine kinase [Hamadaea flava]|uniref:histidine kinase n=1 Tax=Hamadaea flava TaxID=1742688 RepID=A0ABV8LTJ6_9ACTN|nr:sensor histidine kinase [Hamadaea flava]MCP2328722.1 signal transduction histidine kinase [Hamadaea flava]
MPSVIDLYRRIEPWRGYLFDAALAAAMLALSNVAAGKPGQAAPARPWIVAAWWTLGAVIVLGLLLQRRWPVPALVVVTFGAVAHQLISEADNRRIPFPTLIDLAVPVVLYTVACRSRSRWTSLAALAAVAGVEVAASLSGGLIPDAEAGQDGARQAGVWIYGTRADGKSAVADAQLQAFVHQQTLELALVVLLALALGYALGEAARSRQAHVRTLEQRASDLEREHRQRVELAAADERARIGRELHDVIAHSLSVIVVQAQAALAAQHRRPERTAQAVREVITVGRDSLAEMRRLIGAFGPEPDTRDRLASPVGVAALPALIERIRAAGVPVQYSLDGALAELPAGVDASVYRIVQEALTNTLKHAGAGATARVRLATGPEYVEVEVTDDGTGPPAGPDTDDGNGLRGIAERVHLLGGTLTVGPNPCGGFLVRTRLPVPAVVS